MNKIEKWKSEKHGFDVWPDVLNYAQANTPMKSIDSADLERMKWHGVFYRKRDGKGTYMLRIRITGCELTSAQAREIAYIAYEYGYGIVDVTTRANIQVQGLAIENVPRAIKRLGDVGLTAGQTGHDNIRNVFCHPLSGVDGDELIDVRGLCRQITELFINSREYSDLPRKFNIALNGRREHGMHYWTQDISFLATRTPERDVMFQLLIGGTQGQNPQLARHLPVLAAPNQLVDVTRSLLDLFRERGSREKRDRARFRYLVDKIGVGGVLAHLQERLELPLQPHVVEPQPPSGYDELAGWFRQKQPNQWALGLSVPLGRLAWRQLEALALLAKKWGDGNLRTTHEQGMIAVNIPPVFRDAAATDAAACGLSPHADTLIRNTAACTGKQFCNIAVTETKRHMFQLIEQLRRRALALHGIRIHMSGCPSSCALHFTADIGLKGVRVRRLLGTREGFDVFLGGGVAGRVHMAIPYRLGVDIDQLPQLIEETVHEFYTKHTPGQTFSAYWRERLQDRKADKVDDGDYVAPTWVCDLCDHRFLGEDPPVFCPSCGALRRNFARIDENEQAQAAESDSAAQPAPDAEGWILAARADQVTHEGGLEVELQSQQIALFRSEGNVIAVGGVCPHAGGPLAEGELVDGVLTCPWHNWTFDACSGCSIKPAGRNVPVYETKTEDGGVFVKLTAGAQSAESAHATANASAD